MSEANRLAPIVPEFSNHETMLDWFRGLSTSTLKFMWDNECGEVYCDEVHRVMNERGHGDYVAF